MLPKTKHPLFDTKIPSTQETINYRQMLVRDEKILLLAKASEDDSDIYKAVKQVVNNCIYDYDVDKLTTFDIEYLFIKIRGISIGSEVELSFKDLQDEKEYHFNVNLDDIKVIFPDNIDKIIQVSDSFGFSLRYPPASLLDDVKAAGHGEDAYEWIASKCIDSIFDGEDLYKAEECTDQQLLDFILDLDTKSYSKVKEFIANTPRLEYIIEYTNSDGVGRSIALTTLSDFFMLR